MSSLENKINFEVLVEVNLANPNGDPLNGNRPRQDNEDYGIISAECIKRKIRNVMQIKGYPIYVQMQSRSDDGCKSLRDRIATVPELEKAVKKKAEPEFIETACKTWLDTRTFGQVFAFTKDKISIGIAGPVQIQIAKSVLPVEITEMQITKSVNGESKKNKETGESEDGKSSDTMGTRAYVEHGLYVIKGSISPYLAEKTGFSADDAEILKDCLMNLFLGDESAARPAGTVNVRKVIWWTHKDKSGVVSPAKVFSSVEIISRTETPKKYEDYEISVKEIEGISKEEFDL